MTFPHHGHSAHCVNLQPIHLLHVSLPTLSLSAGVTFCHILNAGLTPALSLGVSVTIRPITRLRCHSPSYHLVQVPLPVPIIRCRVSLPARSLGTGVTFQSITWRRCHFPPYHSEQESLPALSLSAGLTPRRITQCKCHFQP